MSQPLQLVFLSGSLRKHSYNTMLLQAIRELAPPGLQLTRHHFDDFPLFNLDWEQGEGIPPQVEALHAAIRGSDGLVIATPEYNHSIPGGLKNAIDWLSRCPFPHAFFGMPTAILGASDGGFGTTRVQYHLRQTLTALNAPTMNHPQILITWAPSKFDAEGRLTDETTRTFLAGWCVEVERWMRRFPRSER